MMNGIHIQISQWWWEIVLPQMSHLISLLFWWVTLNFEQQRSSANKGSGSGDHDSAGQRMIYCHMLSSRIVRRCVVTTSRVGERCCRRLWLRKFQCCYGKSFCFSHVVSPHPHGPSRWGSCERCKVIVRDRKADKNRKPRGTKHEGEIGRGGRKPSSEEGIIRWLHMLYLDWDTQGDGEWGRWGGWVRPEWDSRKITHQKSMRALHNDILLLYMSKISDYLKYMSTKLLHTET